MSSSHRGLLMLAAASLVLGYFGLGQVGAGSGGQTDVGDAGPAAAAGPGGPEAPGAEAGTGGGSSSGAPVTQAAPTVAPGRHYRCAPGLNGGATDRGVTASKIKLASTAVLDGQAASLLKHSVTAMRAVVNKVNRAGGVCGRFLDLTIRNDGFDASRGQLFLKNFMQEDYFALAVVPSAEGLGAAILSGDIRKAAIPVVGTDGMRAEQYHEPWVWPVATATVSTMRVMAQYGYKVKGARSFAIVYDSKYRFGKEGADAFVKQVKAMGGTVKIQTALDPDVTSYSTQAVAFNEVCQDDRQNPTCDMVAMLLLPDTADKWMATHPAIGAKYTAGAQTLFTDDFATKCIRQAGGDCHGFAAWTGYNPPLGAYRGMRDISSYINDARSIDPGAPVNNQFMEGAYLGMSVLVAALEEVGPDLTRARLRAVMDSMRYRSDITKALSWRPGRHGANIWAKAFSIVYANGGFAGWRDEGTGFRPDPRGGP